MTLSACALTSSNGHPQSPLQVEILAYARKSIRQENVRSGSCKSCGSGNVGKFGGEIFIHFLGLKNIDKPVVSVFPELLVCLDCGTAEFAVSEDELRLLASGGLTHKGDVTGAKDRID